MLDEHRRQTQKTGESHLWALMNLALVVRAMDRHDGIMINKIKLIRECPMAIL